MSTFDLTHCTCHDPYYGAPAKRGEVCGYCRLAAAHREAQAKKDPEENRG